MSGALDSSQSASKQALKATKKDGAVGVTRTAAEAASCKAASSSPLLNRMYLARRQTMHSLVRASIDALMESDSGRSVQFVQLGAGLDVSYDELGSEYTSPSSLKTIAVDFQSVLKGRNCKIESSTSKVINIPADLRDIPCLNELLYRPENQKEKSETSTDHAEQPLDPSLPTIWLLEMVGNYLTPQQAEDLCTFCASKQATAPQIMVSYDYMDTKDAFSREVVAAFTNRQAPLLSPLYEGQDPGLKAWACVTRKSVGNMLQLLSRSSSSSSSSSTSGSDFDNLAIASSGDSLQNDYFDEFGSLQLLHQRYHVTLRGTHLPPFSNLLRKVGMRVRKRSPGSALWPAIADLYKKAFAPHCNSTTHASVVKFVRYVVNKQFLCQRPHEQFLFKSSNANANAYANTSTTTTANRGGPVLGLGYACTFWVAIADIVAVSESESESGGKTPETETEKVKVGEGVRIVRIGTAEADEVGEPGTDCTVVGMVGLRPTAIGKSNAGINLNGEAGAGGMELCHMCVDPSQRGAGVGQRLLQAALAIAKGQTQTQTQELELELTVMTHLKAAMSMYEKAGFVKVGGEVHNGGEVYLQRMSLGL